MSYVIYAITDPRSRDVFYIGETGNFVRRCKQHLDGGDQLSGLLIQQIQEAGFVPQFSILERCGSQESALMAEIAWIEFFKSRGAKLSNSQAFNGHADRSAEKRAQAKALEWMQRAKHSAKRLRHIANGRSYEAGEEWSRRDLARLRGMKKAGTAPALMAKRLGRDIEAVRAKLESL